MSTSSSGSTQHQSHTASSSSDCDVVVGNNVPINVVEAIYDLVHNARVRYYLVMYINTEHIHIVNTAEQTKTEEVFVQQLCQTLPTLSSSAYNSQLVATMSENMHKRSKQPLEAAPSSSSTPLVTLLQGTLHSIASTYDLLREFLSVPEAYDQSTHGLTTLVSVKLMLYKLLLQRTEATFSQSAILAYFSLLLNETLHQSTSFSPFQFHKAHNTPPSQHKKTNNLPRLLIEEDEAYQVIIQPMSHSTSKQLHIEKLHDLLIEKVQEAYACSALDVSIGLKVDRLLAQVHWSHYCHQICHAYRKELQDIVMKEDHQVKNKPTSAKPPKQPSASSASSLHSVKSPNQHSTHSETQSIVTASSTMDKCTPRKNTTTLTGIRTPSMSNKAAEISESETTASSSVRFTDSSISRIQHWTSSYLPNSVHPEVIMTETPSDVNVIGSSDNSGGSKGSGSGSGRRLVKRKFANAMVDATPVSSFIPPSPHLFA